MFSLTPVRYQSPNDLHSFYGQAMFGKHSHVGCIVKYQLQCGRCAESQIC